MEQKNNTPDFVRERITALRLEKHVSEYQMSYDLGHSRGYINNISSGKSLPSMREFLYICNYFDITPEDFFRSENRYPIAVGQVMKQLEKMSKENLKLIANLADQLIQSENRGDDK